MTKQIEEQALIELSIRLAPQTKAPPNMLRSLAKHDSISIAGPVLINSKLLTDGDLVEIVKSKSQARLTMIARRAELNEIVTDVLVDHGQHRRAQRGREEPRRAHFPFDHGQACVLRRAGRQAHRFDLQSSRCAAGAAAELVRQATESVRAKLMKATRPDQAPVVEEVMRDMAKRLTNAPRQD